MKRLMGLCLVVLLTGCGDSKDKDPALTVVALTNPGKRIRLPPKVDEKTIMRMAQQEEKEFRDELAKGNKVLFDAAEATIREALAKTYGKDNAKAATVKAEQAEEEETDKDKWSVYGTLSCKDADGVEKNTLWVVQLELWYGRLKTYSLVFVAEGRFCVL